MRTFLEISRSVRRISRAPRPASAVAAVDQRWSRDHRSLTTCVASVADVFGAKTTSWFNYQLIWMWRVNGAHNTATSATSSRHGEPACISIANGFWRTRRRRDGIVPRLGSSALASLFFPGEFLFLISSLSGFRRISIRELRLFVCEEENGRSSYTQKDNYWYFSGYFDDGLWGSHFVFYHKIGRCLEGAAAHNNFRKSDLILLRFFQRETKILEEKWFCLTLVHN